MSRLTINSNIASINAQRNFSSNTKKLSESFLRLSSGLRINRASDDAAGLSISESLKTDTRIMNQGMRNLNDGLSALSIADGALSELSDITIRLRELATQSANRTLGNRQRQALDQEAQSLAKEYNRIARTTEFNGRKLFDADFGDLMLSAGAGRAGLITEDLGGAIGDATFASAVTYTGDSITATPISGDFNGDGFIDIVTTDEFEFTASLFLGNGDGTFKARSTLTASGFVLGVAAADLNNDGSLDLVVGATAEVTVFLGNGNGSFKARQSISSGLGYGIAIEDFNNDGNLDVISTDLNIVNLMIGNGNGSFKGRVSYATGAFPTAIATDDYNNDGVLDIAVSESSSNTMSVLFGNANGSFRSRVSYNASSGISHLISQDINGDGFEDIIGGNNDTSVFLANSDGSFKARQVYVGGGAVQYPFDLVDLDSDGALDLVSINGLLLGNGDGSFMSPFTNTIYGNLAVDLNNDGVRDLVGTYADDALYIYIANKKSGIQSLHPFSIGTRMDALNSMTLLESTFNKITEHRGQIGALQSRVETASNNLQQSTLA